MVIVRSSFNNPSSFSLGCWAPLSSSSGMAASTVVIDAIPAVPSWSCDEVLPARPFGCQKEAVDTSMKYAIRQGFAVSTLRSNFRETMHVSLRCTEIYTGLLDTGNITTSPWLCKTVTLQRLRWLRSPARDWNARTRRKYKSTLSLHKGGNGHHPNVIPRPCYRWSSVQHEKSVTDAKVVQVHLAEAALRGCTNV